MSLGCIWWGHWQQPLNQLWMPIFFAFLFYLETEQTQFFFISIIYKCTKLMDKARYRSSIAKTFRQRSWLWHVSSQLQSNVLASPSPWKGRKKKELRKGEKGPELPPPSGLKVRRRRGDGDLGSSSLPSASWSRWWILPLELGFWLVGKVFFFFGFLIERGGKKGKGKQGIVISVMTFLYGLGWWWFWKWGKCGIRETEPLGFWCYPVRQYP